MASVNLSHRQPICVRCVQNLTCKRNEVMVRLSENRIVEADLWQCPSCGYQIVTGFAQEYVDRHDRPALFEAWDKNLQALGPAVVIGAPYKDEVYAKEPESICTAACDQPSEQHCLDCGCYQAGYQAGTEAQREPAGGRTA